jgi:acetoin utilization deacetylase AcuC-like enzyme
MKVFYSDDYVGSGHAFDTTRKSRWIADSLAAHPVRDVGVLAPAPLTRETLSLAHSRRYIDAVQSGEPRDVATSQGFGWDPGLWRAVCASNGGVVEAALAAMEDGVAGSLSSGLHHARRSYGHGFCTFNGLVIAAHVALDAGARRVMILDLDAHCGGGTYEMILGESRIAHRDVSVSPYDSDDADGQWQRQVTVGSARDYLAAVESVLDPVPEKVELVIYNAGMDPYQGSSIGGMRGITLDMLDRRESLVFDWARRRELPIAFVLAGGYTGPQLENHELVLLHRLTIEAAARAAA